MPTRPKSIMRMDSSDLNLESINMLVYAHPGEGKTPFWGTGGERLLLMDSDHGYESAASSGSKASKIPVTDYDELEEVYQWLLGTNCKEFDWVVWDSLTLFQERALIDDIMVDAVAESDRQEEFVPSKREYLINMNRVGRYVRQFVDLPINFGISCHVLMDARDPDGKPMWLPLIQGKGMPGRISGYMNVVGFLGKAKVKKGADEVQIPRMLTMQNGRYYARDRFRALGPHVDNPTLPKIEAAINKKRQEVSSGSAAPTPPRRRVARRAS